MSEPASFLLHRANALEVRRVIAKLATIGYSEHSIRDRLGLQDITDLQWRAVPMYRADSLASRDPLALAIDLFLLQGAASAEELARLFCVCERDALLETGLLVVHESGFARARASLFPVGDHLIFADHAWPELAHPGYATVPSDHVMAIGRDSRNLAHCTIRRPFHSALDLCTGSGIQALLASRHSERVTAVDINPRAVYCTRFNAHSLGLQNLEAAEGDLFAPVAGVQFDLITANPPFVPSPLDTLRFRDGGPSGEEIQKRIVADLPHHLAPGGVAQMVTELGERNHEPLTLRLREWLHGAPIDIYSLRLGEHSAETYAIGHAKGNTYQEFLDSTERWATNLRAQGYSRIVSLVISFQWTDANCGPPWERVDESPPPRRAAGGEIDAAFRAERETRRLGCDISLKRASLRRAGPTALIDAHVLGGPIPAKAQATVLGRALRIEHQVDAMERQILTRMAGSDRLPVSELIKSFRALDIDEPNVIAAARSLVRRQLAYFEG